MTTNINSAKHLNVTRGVFKIGYFIVFVIIAVCIGIYFQKEISQCHHPVGLKASVS